MKKYFINKYNKTHFINVFESDFKKAKNQYKKLLQEKPHNFKKIIDRNDIST